MTSEYVDGEITHTGMDILVYSLLLSIHPHPSSSLIGLAEYILYLPVDIILYLPLQLIDPPVISSICYTYIIQYRLEMRLTVRTCTVTLYYG